MVRLPSSGGGDHPPRHPAGRFGSAGSRGAIRRPLAKRRAEPSSRRSASAAQQAAAAHRRSAAACWASASSAALRRRHCVLFVMVRSPEVRVTGRCGRRVRRPGNPQCRRRSRPRPARRPAVPIEDLPLVGQPLNPELRDAAVADFPFGVVGVLREDQGVEAVPAERSADPGAAAGGPPRGLRDLQVEAYVEVVVRCVHRSVLSVGFLRSAVASRVTQLPRVSPGI